jgi:hypothetical protein
MERTVRQDDYQVAHRTPAFDLSIVLRVIGAVAAGVMTVIGLVAVAKVSWANDGFDAAAVDVAGMTFTPEVAVATAAAGVVALIAAALWDITSKLVVGGLLLVTGIVILLTGSDEVNANWTFENGQGWLAIAVGAILVVAAILMQMMWTSRRVGHRDPIAT